jgi:hypothetical protein
MANYISKIPNGETVDALLSYVSRLTTANDSEVTNLILSGIVLTGRSDNNFIVNSTYNTIDDDVTRCVIGGGGASGFANKIGSTTKPAGADFTPPGWADDTDYPAGAAGVATIAGGYDNIVNQLAGTICGGGHNFIKYNPGGHSFIGGGGYNLVAGSASAIVMGGHNSIVRGARSFIGSGESNVIAGSYSNILGGNANSITGDYSSIIGGNGNIISSNYSMAFGRRAKSIATGTCVLADSQDAEFLLDVPNTFASRFSGGYRLMGGRVGIGIVPHACAALHVYSTTGGFLPPRMTTEQRDAISSPVGGLMIYNTTTKKLNFYNGTAWETVTSSVV